ncbi:unnamed protein product [Musa textilis]
MVREVDEGEGKGDQEEEKTKGEGRKPRWRMRRRKPTKGDHRVGGRDEVEEEVRGNLKKN